jgi:hypothetical protein
MLFRIVKSHTFTEMARDATHMIELHFAEVKDGAILPGQDTAHRESRQSALYSRPASAQNHRVVTIG